MRCVGQWLLLLVLVGMSAPAAATYGAECRMLASQLASDPGMLKLGELDVLKSCLSSLQRGITAGDPPPAPTPPPVAICPPPPPEKVCPVCPEAPACPEPVRSADDPARQRFIPRY